MSIHSTLKFLTFSSTGFSDRQAIIHSNNKKRKATRCSVSHHQSWLIPVLLTLLTNVFFSATWAQDNFSVTNATFFKTGYTDIATTGAAIVMTNNESGVSVNPINIGFDFNFNGTTFNECMIHADGILRFGSLVPGGHPDLFTNNDAVSGSVYTSANALYQNCIMPFFMDLAAGSASPQYHVLTTGTAPERVTTLQWKNLKDNNNAGSTAQNQFSNIEFQVKLYEAGNNIQFVYGNFLPSVNAGASRIAQVGMKANSTSFLAVQKTGGSIPVHLSEFINPAVHSVFPATFPVRNTLNIPPGFSYLFYGALATDAGIGQAYVDAAVTTNASAPAHNKVLVKNEGTASLSNINVTMNISGANTFQQIINVATLAAGDQQLIGFSGYPINNTGQQNVEFSVDVAGDQRLQNNTQTIQQRVTSGFVQNFADSQNTRLGVGFQSSSGEIAVKMYGSGVKKISQVRIPVSTYLVNVNLRIIEDNGTGGNPGTVIHTSPAFLSSADNEIIYNLATPVTVDGDYYITLRQNSANNYGWNVSVQNPIDANRIFSGASGVFTVQPPDRPWHPLVKVVHETNLPDVGIIAITNPACNYGTAEPVNVVIRNFSSATHDFSTTPVTITGNAINNISNVSFPFSIEKNTGSIAAGAFETLTVMPSYDFSTRAIHSFTAKTNLAGDAEPLNDSITFRIVNQIRNTRNFSDSVCPFTPVTITAASNVYNNLQWSVNNQFAGSGPSFSFEPSQTSVVKITATDYRGCAITDSIIVAVKANGIPPTPLITFNDTLLRSHNQFSDTLMVAPLAGHSINWLGGGSAVNDGQEYLVTGPQGANPATHMAYYRNTVSACGGAAATITTRFAPGVLMNENATISVCDTSFYDFGGPMASTGNNFTRSFLPATPGTAVKLDLYHLDLSRFATFFVLDGPTASSPRIAALSDAFNGSTKQSFVASNPDGALTVRFSIGSFTSSGWLAGFSCYQPQQFRSITNGSWFTQSIWQSKLPAEPETAWKPAASIPSKGDDTIFIMHQISIPSTILADQLIVANGGALSVNNSAHLNMYKSGDGSSMLVQQGGSLAIGPTCFVTADSLEVKGTLTNGGNITGNVIFSGSSPQLLIAQGTANKISRLTINNPSGVSVQGIHEITSLVLQNGLINTSAGNSIMLENVEGQNETSYINGPVQFYLRPFEDKELPIGKSGAYRPIGLSAQSANGENAGIFETEVMDGAPPTRNLPTGITNVSGKRYYSVKVLNNTSNMRDFQIKLPYGADDGVTDETTLKIAKDDGAGNWVDLGGFASGPTPGNISSIGFDNFSDFVLANVSGGPLPLTLVNFTARFQNNTGLLKWQTNNEHNLAHFELQRSLDGIHFTGISTLTAANNMLGAGYQFTDNRLPDASIVYYRLKMIEKDGRYTYSAILPLRKQTSGNFLVSVNPNPFGSNLFVTLQSSKNARIQTRVIDAKGAVVKLAMMDVQEGTNQISMQASDLPPGVYELQIISDKEIVTKKIVKH